jgi:hypothetical protein
MTEQPPIAVPNIIVLDLHTSGIYLRDQPISSNSQPWAPYISALQCNDEGQVINHFACYVRSEGRMVKGGALDRHGIDHKASNRLGIPEPRALGLLADMLKVGPFQSYMKIVTFGDMDPMVISSLFARFALSQNKPQDSYDKLWLSRPKTTFIDLQKPYAQQVCKLESEIPDMPDYRWPKFDEAVKGVLGRENAGRDSLADIIAMKDMYFDFKRRGFFPDIKHEDAG